MAVSTAWVACVAGRLRVVRAMGTFSSAGVERRFFVPLGFVSDNPDARLGRVAVASLRSAARLAAATRRAGLSPPPNRLSLFSAGGDVKFWHLGRRAWQRSLFSS